MKRLLIALVLIASVTVASAQTKPAKKKAAAAKKECKMSGDGSCCEPTSKAKAVSSAKKEETKKI